MMPFSLFGGNSPAKLTSTFILTILMAFPSTISLSHDQWSDGTTVPPWVKAECCGEADAHHLANNQVHQVPCDDDAKSTCYTFDGYHGKVAADRLLPSQDGSWWAFWRPATENVPESQIYCFFGPLSF